MTINIPPLHQTNSHNCVAACVKIILLQSLSSSPSIAKIARAIQIDTGGAFLESAARYLAWDQNLKPTLVMFDSSIHPRWYKQASIGPRLRDLRKRIKARQKFPGNRKRYCAFLELITAGGKWRVKPISFLILKKIVHRGVPVIVTLEENIISDARNDDTESLGHAVVMMGFNRKSVFIVDPAEGTRRRIPICVFISAWYKAGGEALYLRKN